MSESQVEGANVAGPEPTALESVSENVFDSLVNWKEQDEDTPAPVEKVEEPVVKEPAPTPAKPVEAPSIAAKEVPKVEAKPAAPVEAKPPVEAPKPAEPAPVAQPPFDPVKVRSNMVKELEAVFALSPEETERMTTEPEKVMATVQARAAMWTYEALYYTLANMAPQLIRNIIQQDSGTKEKEEAFFSRWGDLKELVSTDKKKAEQLGHIAQFWRSQNPSATKEQAIEGIGQMAAAMFGVQPKAAAPAAPAPQLKPIPPRTPARASAGPAKPVAPSTNAFEALVNWEEPDE